MLGGLLIHGLMPGPLLFQQHKTEVYLIYMAIPVFLIYLGVNERELIANNLIMPVSMGIITRLLANHGALCVGRDLRAALCACHYLEKLVQAFLFATWTGQISVLPSDVVEAEMAFFRMRR